MRAAFFFEATMSLETYIRQAAAARGIDPDVAVRVAKGEGGLQNPFRHGEGPAPRSQAAGLGSTENSYGPFQLYVSGTGAGLGDRAMAVGIDPSKDWQKGVDFALDEAKNKGWGQWYGAKAQGITGMAGIGGAPGPFAGMADGPKGQEAYAPPSPFGSMSPMMADNSIDPNVAKYAFADDKNPIGNRLSKAGELFSRATQPPRLRPGPFPGGPSAEQAGGLLKATNNTNQLASMLLGRRIA